MLATELHLHQNLFFFLNISQRIRATVNTQEQKRLLMDLDISMRTVDCFYTVTFYGALFREVRGYCYTAPWVCVCPLNAQNCLKPPVSYCRSGLVEVVQSPAIAGGSRSLSMLQQQVPKHVGGGLGWISSRTLLDVAVGSAIGGTPTSVPTVIRCSAGMWSAVAAPWGCWIALGGSVVPLSAPTVSFGSWGGWREFPIATFSPLAG